jgi:hypothetical protein
MPRNSLPRKAAHVVSAAPGMLDLPDYVECEFSAERRGIEQEPGEDETGLLGDLLAEGPYARSSSPEGLSVGDRQMHSPSVFVFLAEPRRSLDPEPCGCLLRGRGRGVIVSHGHQPYDAAAAYCAAAGFL